MAHQEDSTYIELDGIALKKREAPSIEIECKKDLLHSKEHRLAYNRAETAAAVVDELLSQLGGC